jgi:tetratricopeptide (TPR) repeat protein
MMRTLLTFLLLTYSATLFRAQSAAELLRIQQAKDLTTSGDKKRKAEDFSGAQADYTSSITINQKAAEEYIKKTEKHSKMTAYEIALADDGRAPEPKIDWALPYYGRGMCENALNQKAEALKDFETALALHPKMGEAYYERAMLKYSKDDKDHQCMDLRMSADCGYDKGRIAYEDNFCWNNSLSHYKEGITKLNIKSFDEALVEFDIAIRINPDSANIYVRRGQCYAGLNKFDEAINEFKFALKKDSANAEAHLNLGMAYQSKDDNQKAFDEFSKVIKANSNNYDAYLHRAQTCESQGQFASAIFDYGNVIRLKPANGDNYYKRGVLKRDNLHNDQDACDDFCKAADLGCSDAEEFAKDCRNPYKKKKKN